MSIKKRPAKTRSYISFLRGAMSPLSTDAPLLTDLDEAKASHVHQRLDFPRISIEILDRERVDGDVRDVELEEERQDAFERLEALLVADTNRFALDSSIAPITVHDEGDVLRSGSQAKGPDQEGPQSGVQGGWDVGEEGR